MNSFSIMPLIANLPNGAGYISLVKVGVVVVLLLLWGLAVQWVDKDTDIVKTKREQWNLIIVSGGLVGFFVLLVPPIWAGSLFVVGLAFWALLAGGAVLFYVIHRNGRVVPDSRVLTPTHFKRLFSGSGEAKARKDDKGLRVRITDHDGKFVEKPRDAEEAADYEAVQDFLYDVLWRRVSDADMLAGKEKFRVVYQIDGLVNEKEEGIPLESGERIFRFLKKVAGLNVEEIRRPQRGKIETALLSHAEDVGHTEVLTSGTTAGERLRLRVQSGPTLRRIPDLGLAKQRLERLKSILSIPHGMFVISSTKSNGATTSQYAILRSHDAYMHNIYALERRTMIELDNITQQLYDGANTDVNYARALQTVLRREPDIVLVSDCDDRETVQLAAKAATDERKIYVGLAAKDSFDALGQLLKFVEDDKLVAKALLGVLSQRLVRKLCAECREAYRPDETTLRKLNLPVDKIERFYRPPSEPKFDKKGRPILCTACQGTGYVGRIGVFELLVADDEVRNLIAKGAPIKSIKAQCRKNKMYYLQEEGVLKVIDGTTSMNEVLRVLRNTDK